MVRKNNLWKQLVLLVLIALFGVLSFNRFNYDQKRNSETYWKGNIFADAGGYYLYLPALFIYHFDDVKLKNAVNGELGPEGGILVIGQGGKIADHKISTKYFSGVALMQAPFFFMVYAYDPLDGKIENGFTPLYSMVPLLASIFYYLLAFVLLFFLLNKRVPPTVTISILISIIFGTNVIYYFSAFPGYSHAYSFFLVSAFLFLSHKFSVTENKKLFFLLIFVLSLIVITRPVNFIIGLLFFIENKPASLKKFFNLKALAISLTIGFLVLFPQLAYYKYLFGSFFKYAYSDAGFSNWRNPYLFEVWFSLRSGLFAYNPIWFLFVAIAIILSIKKNTLGLISLGIFAFYSYMTASWHVWSFGCSYGSRNFVEITPLFALLMAVFYEKILIQSKWLIALIVVIVASSTYYNFMLMDNFEKCYFGFGDWDTNYFKNELLLK